MKISTKILIAFSVILVLSILNTISNSLLSEKVEENSDLKVFVMTTSNEASERARTEELGISGYIIKPMRYAGNIKNSDSMEAFVQFHLTKIFSES